MPLGLGLHDLEHQVLLAHAVDAGDFELFGNFQKLVFGLGL
jgi:hypothetical protein